MGVFTTEERKKPLAGKKVSLHAYVFPEVYNELRKHADPDDGDRWEAPLLRRIVREWLEAQKKSTSTTTSRGSGWRLHGKIKT